MLRYWKGVVAKAYEDFPQSVPDENPPDLCFALLKEDGRTEHSKYPNSFYTSAREEHGI